MKESLKKFIHFMILLCLICVFFSCHSDNLNSDSFNTELVIEEGFIEKDGNDIAYQLLRLEGRKTPTYAVYFPGQTNEAVLLTRPYATINWTGETVDEQHSNPVTTQQILDDCSIYIFNGFSVLNVFARFYTGGDIQNDIDDITAGMDFLSKKAEKIGISGSSWGGFEALYGAVNSNVIPVVGVAYYPPSDMKSWSEWAQNTNESFFTGYRERIESAAAGDYSRWSHEFIVQNLNTDFLLLHSEADTLVPVEQSQLLAALDNRIHLFLMQKRSEPLSHGADIKNYDVPIEYTVSTSYLMFGLTIRNIVTMADSRALAELEDGYEKNLLLENRIQLYEVNEKKILSQEEKESLLD